MDAEARIGMLERQVADMEKIIGILLEHVSHPIHFSCFIPMTEKEIEVDLQYYFEKVKASRQALRERVAKN
jgi:uncharacterized coiled-coil protein SlyX